MGAFAKTILVALLHCALFANQAAAQPIDACTKSELASPDRIVWSCANGLVIEAEKGASPLREMPGRRPAELELGQGGLFIELPTGTGPFQISTPHAIASVRGTVFVVDVTDVATAVFVIKGLVAVQRDTSLEPVLLGPGDGVTVAEGEPLTVKQWPAAKVTALLARFGR